MINGKSIDKVHYLTMLRSLQRMRELDELEEWYVCDEGQLMTDFCPISAILPCPMNAIVTFKPIRSWQSHREYQWFARLRDEIKCREVYFTAICE